MYTIDVTTYYYNNTTTQKMLYRFDTEIQARNFLEKEMGLTPISKSFPMEYAADGQYPLSHNEYARPTYKIIQETKQ